MSRSETAPLGRVWLTRDLYIDGSLLPLVCVWSSCPRRRADGTWVTDGPHVLSGFVESMTVAEALKLYKTIPETDHECVRFG